MKTNQYLAPMLIFLHLFSNVAFADRSYESKKTKFNNKQSSLSRIFISDNGTVTWLIEMVQNNVVDGDHYAGELQVKDISGNVILEHGYIRGLNGRFSVSSNDNVIYHTEKLLENDASKANLMHSFHVRHFQVDSLGGIVTYDCIERIRWVDLNQDGVEETEEHYDDCGFGFFSGKKYARKTVKGNFHEMHPYTPPPPQLKLSGTLHLGRQVYNNATRQYESVMEQ